MTKKSIPFKMPQISQPVPEIPLQEFKNTEEVFKDPTGIIFTPNKKRLTLEKIEEAYLQAWISQKLIEITYQRFLHDFYDKSGLVVDALKNELGRTQAEVKIAEGILNTIKDWYKNV